MRTLGVAILATLLSSTAAAADVVFEGTPKTRVEVSLGAVTSEAVTRKEAEQRRLVITRDGEQYFWASRDNVPLYRLDSGEYVTYVAANGVGYVRVLAPGKARGRTTTYMEHLTVQLGSLTYFGS